MLRWLSFGKLPRENLPLIINHFFQESPFVENFQKKKRYSRAKTCGLFRYLSRMAKALGFCMIESLETTPLLSHSKLADEELVSACANSTDEDLWDEFFARFRAVIAGAVYRETSKGGSVSTQVLQDLTQETCLKILDPDRKVLARFKPRHPGSVKGFLRAVTINLVIDHLRAVGRERNRIADNVDVTQEDSLSAADITETVTRIERNLLLQKVDTVLVESEGPTARRDRNIFWFHYQKGMSAREISEVQGVGLSAKGVEATLRRTTMLVRERLTTSGQGAQKSEKNGGEDFKAAASL